VSDQASPTYWFVRYLVLFLKIQEIKENKASQSIVNMISVSENPMILKPANTSTQLHKLLKGLLIEFLYRHRLIAQHNSAEEHPFVQT